jgi:hypothetical protein
MVGKAKKGAIGGPPAAFLKALERLLRPLVGAAMALGVTFPLFIRLLKRVYISVATAESRAGGGAVTVSRISVMTGLQRKDIGQIQEQMERKLGPPANVSLGARLIGIWSGAKEFTDGAGRPLPLARFGEAHPTFEDLVRTVSSDVRPRAVLDEWLRVGVVDVDDEDRVRLKADAFVPRAGFDELAYFYGRNLGDHIAASSHNLAGAGEPFLERAVYYDKLTPASAAALERFTREIGIEALTRINREALRLADGDEGKPGANQRMSAGIYFYRGADDGEPDHAS